MELKARLRSAEGQPALGAFLGVPAPFLVEVMGRVGFDFVVLDGEHGSFSPQQGEELLRAADAVGLPAIVRVPDGAPSGIQSALDGGAAGVQVPSVETPEQARAIVEASRFPPGGRRGFGSTTRAAGHGLVPRAEVIRRAAERTTVVIQIETRRGVDRLDRILEVVGVDAVFVGTADLSLDYGLESAADPAMLPLLEDVVGRIRRSGRTCGVHLADPRLLPEMMALGVDYFTTASLAAVARSLRQVVQEFGEAVARRPPR